MKSWQLILLTGSMATGCTTEAPKACSPPRSTWGHPRSFGVVELNKIALDREGKIYWNGKKVSREALDKHLAESSTFKPEPWVFLETEMGMSCAAVEAIRDQIEKHVNCPRRCNEGIMTVWDNIPWPPGTPVS